MKQKDGREPERFQKLVTLFHELHEMQEAERSPLLEETRVSDPDLAAELVRMLNEANGVEGFLETPAFGGLRNAVPEVLAGDIIGHYRIVSLLGSGGMGIVYHAEDSRLNRRVALKFLAPHLVGYGQSRERFVKEAQAAAALRHPNVCPVYEIGDSDSGAYIVMALLEGETLAQRISRGPIPVWDAVTVALDTATGLEAAHAKGIVHQDVKPANLMITPGSDRRVHATLMDFGLARMTELTHNTKEGLLAGTISYMSPERVAGAHVDRRTDLWSLGVILFEMLTGQKPFRGANDRVVLDAIVHLNPKAPSTLRPSIPQELDRIVAKAMAKQPERRYGTATEFIGDLQRVAEELAGKGERRPALLSRRWMIGSGAVGCAAAAGYFWRRQQTNHEPVQLLIKDGNAKDPAFSPDGSRIVFSWKPPTVDHFQLYVVGEEGGEPRQLTNGPADDSDPAWSPDGTRVCFTRQGLGESALYVKLLRNNAEQRVTTLINSSYSNRLDWLGDSRTVVLAENWFNMPLTLVDVESGSRREVMAPAPAGYNSPRLSPDRKWIAVAQFFSQTTADLFIVPVSGGEGRRITFDNYAKRDYRWMPDGRGITYRAPDKKGFAWWYVPAEGGAPSKLKLPDFTVGSFDLVRDSPGTVKLVAADRRWTIGISRMEIPVAGQPSSSAVPLIVSAGNDALDADPAVSPDGLRIAFISTRSGHPEIWATSNEGRGAEQLTSFGGPEVTQPAWSPDGRYLISASAPEAKRNLFLVDVAARSVRWLTTSGLEETEPQWSRDGRWITFASSRSGRQELWRMLADGGAARQLTYKGGAVNRESPDGRWIYYVRHEQPGLWRVPADGGAETIVLDRVSSELYRAWAVGRKGIYYTFKNEKANTWTVALYNPEHGTDRPLATFDKPLPRWSGTLTLSPDERWMLLPILQAEGSKIVLFSGIQTDDAIRRVAVSIP